MMAVLPKRPYPPVLTAKRFADAVDMYKSFVTQEHDRHMIAANLEACFAGNPNAKAMRKVVMQKLVGKTSTNDLTDGETIAFKKWLNARPGEDGKWQTDYNTMQEAIQLHAAELKEQGQKELFMTDNIPDAVVTEPIPAEQPPNNPVARYAMTNTNINEGAELNLFFKCPGGIKGHLKLFGPNGKELLEVSATAALLYLNTHGYEPEHGAASGNGHGTEPTREDLPADGTASATYCTIHNCEMKRREKDGQVWFSHKIAGTDDWCRGEQ